MINSLESPVIQIDSLKTKFDTVVVSNSLIALLDHNYDEARFLQQLHYWCYSKYGVVIDGIRWIYKSGREFLTEALLGLTEWKLRRTIASLLERDLIRREKLFTKHQEQEYKSFWWQPRNQTYYYSINYEELQKLIKKAETVENVRFVESTKLSVEEFKETKVCELSPNSTNITNKRKPTTKQEENRLSDKNPSFAAAGLKKPFKEGESQTRGNTRLDSSTASTGQNKVKSEATQSNSSEEKSSAKVDYIVNKDWKSLIPLLDSTGVPINKTIKDLLKLYPSEKVEGAIAILKERKRDQYILNPSGYFVSALKEEWSGQNVTVGDSGDCESQEVDKGAVFPHWYDLAKRLGYCSGQEVRKGDRWVCLSGAWEKWQNAVERGYSLDYLKKIMKRNSRQ